MFYFCEHGKQAFSQIFFFKLMKEPAHSLFFFLSFFLSFFAQLGSVPFLACLVYTLEEIDDP